MRPSRLAAASRWWASSSCYGARSGFFGAVSRGINRAFSDGKPLFILREKLLGILLILFSGGLILASVAVGLVTSYLQNATRDIVDRFQGGDVAVALIGSVVPFLLVFVAYLVLYRVVPSQKVTFGDVWPGAFVAAVLWTLLRVGYTIYVTQIAHFEDLFGPLAAIITLIVFIYFASVVLLVGAEVARANLIEAREAPPSVMGGHFALAKASKRLALG